MRILVTGKSGQLGNSIQKLISNIETVNNFIFADRKELNLESQDSIAHYFNINDRFDIVVNCAAYTAVDKAEKDPDLANQINHLAVKQMAEIANKKGSKFIHISTDYVFDGKSSKPYTEEDETNPLNTYGKTKLAGEQAVQELMPINAIIIRTSWLYSEYGNNFVKAMLKLGEKRKEISVVSDQIGSPTYATDLAEAILTIINGQSCVDKEESTEVYHYSNDGKTSWYDFSKEIFRLSQIKCKIMPITTEQYPATVQRPKNTLMSKNKISAKFGVEITSWKDSIKRFMNTSECL